MNPYTRFVAPDDFNEFEALDKEYVLVMKEFCYRHRARDGDDGHLAAVLMYHAVGFANTIYYEKNLRELFDLQVELIKKKEEGQSPL